MGISSSRVKVDRAWDDIGKSSEEQLQHQRNLSCFRCASICLPRQLRDTRSSTTDTGSMLSAKNSCIAPSQHTMHSDMSLKSDETEQPLSLRRGDGDVTVSTRLRRFTYVDLKLATRSFRSDSLLGEGGFGCVYKGWIDENGGASVKPRSGLTVAVKTLNHGGLQGHKEWLAEVTYLGQLHHPNLVKLIGYCIEEDKRLLVYEFMQRGSLENHLFRKRASPLSWNTRMKIALGAARGVEFLHTRDRPVIYRDLKTSNILLDGDYTAKLSDFGLAKDGPQGDKSHVSTTVMGTYGYAAPEYVMTGHLSSKSDIYSFGVVLLELLTGKRSMDKTRPNGEQNLAAWARPYLNRRARLLDIIDSRLEQNYSLQGILKAGHLTCLCLSRDPKVRPSMRTIVEVLEQIQEMKDPATSTGALPISTAGKFGQPASTVNVENMGRRSSGRSLR